MNILKRCAGCEAPATHGSPYKDPWVLSDRLDRFHGGAFFLYPNDATASEGVVTEHSVLCPACAKKTAEFVKYLHDTNGGKR